MNHPTAYHQLGRFIVSFQHAEATLTELLVLIVNADEEAIRILVNELEYNNRVKTTDVMFARFVDLHREPDEATKSEFHKLMVEFGKLGERRNEIVHSKYMAWLNVEGDSGLIRQKSALRASKGTREDEEEELLPDAFNADFKRISIAL